jgi:hypothetical protein
MRGQSSDNAVDRDRLTARSWLATSSETVTVQKQDICHQYSISLHPVPWLQSYKDDNGYHYVYEIMRPIIRTVNSAA